MYIYIYFFLVYINVQYHTYSRQGTLPPSVWRGPFVLARVTSHSTARVFFFVATTCIRHQAYMDWRLRFCVAEFGHVWVPTLHSFSAKSASTTKTGDPVHSYTIDVQDGERVYSGTQGMCCIGFQDFPQHFGNRQHLHFTHALGTLVRFRQALPFHRTSNSPPSCWSGHHPT